MPTLHTIASTKHPFHVSLSSVWSSLISAIIFKEPGLSLNLLHMAGLISSSYCFSKVVCSELMSITGSSDGFIPYVICTLNMSFCAQAINYAFPWIVCRVSLKQLTWDLISVMNMVVCLKELFQQWKLALKNLKGFRDRLGPSADVFAANKLTVRLYRKNSWTRKSFKAMKFETYFK